MKSIRCSILLICLALCPAGLFAQSPAQAFAAWTSCNFDQFGVPPMTPGGSEWHVAMLGNSNGALWMVPPQAELFDFTKRWERFLVPTPKTGGTWRVLHTAFPGMESWILRDVYKKCIDTRPDFRAKFPMRIWLQVGGNDILQTGSAIIDEFLPHLAHYRINAILNNIGEIVEISQRHGRTVLLVSYFPLPKFQAWQGERRSPLGEYARACTDSGPGGPGANQELWIARGVVLGSRSVFCNPIIAEVVGEIYNVIVNADLPFISPLLNGETLKWSLRDLDNEYGRMLGFEDSLTGLVKNPGRVLQKKWDKLRGHKRPRVKLGIAEAWDFITRQPRGIVGWELVNVLPNRRLANSVIVHRLGQRYREIYTNQSTHIQGYRGTVSFLDIAPEFYDYNSHFPPQYVGRDEFYADDKHLNAEGFKRYGAKVAEFMNLADYDIYFSDEQYVKAHQKPKVTYTEDPHQEDVGLLLACIWLGWCGF